MVEHIIDIGVTAALLAVFTANVTGLEQKYPGARQVVIEQTPGIAENLTQNLSEAEREIFDSQLLHLMNRLKGDV